MKWNVHKRLFASAVLGFVCLLGLFGGITTVAQTADPERAARIRDQIGATGTRMVNEADLISLRTDLNNAMEAIVSRIDVLEKDMVDMKSRIRVLDARTTPTGATISVPVSPGVSSAPSQSASSSSGSKANTIKTNVSVCVSGCDAAKFSDAVALVAEGGTITVEPGVYFDCIKIHKSMKLVGKIGKDGSRAHLKKIACSGKGAIDLEAPDVTIQGLKISDISVPDRNGACIRIGPKSEKIFIRDVICQNSENGLLGAPNNQNGVLTIEDSTFEGNGRDGRAHDIYVNGGKEAIFRNVKILSANNGHLLKTGAPSTLVENSIIAALGGNSGAAINAYGGGKLTVRNSVLQLGPNAQNHNFIAYADEPNRIVPGSEHAILFENNWFIYDDANRCCRWIFNKLTNILGETTFRNNKFVGRIDPNNPAVDMRPNKEYADRDKAGLRKYDGTIDSMPTPGS